MIITDPSRLASAFGKWTHEAIIEFVKKAPVQVMHEREHDDSKVDDGRVWPSAANPQQCIKRHILQRRKIIPEISDSGTLLLFASAKFVAAMIKTALAHREIVLWRYLENTELGEEYSHASIIPEFEFLSDERMSGKADASTICWPTDKNAPSLFEVPIEIKYMTSPSAQLARVEPAYAWQAVHYAHLQPSPISLLVTVYRTNWAVWAFVREGAGYRMWEVTRTGLLIEPGPIAIKPEIWPEGGLFTDVQRDQIVDEQKRLLTMTDDEAIAYMPHNSNPFDKPCVGYADSPENYKRAYNGAKAGDPKPDKGRLKWLCPFYGQCHYVALKEAGYDPSEYINPPEGLELELRTKLDDKGQIILRAQNEAESTKELF